ncbi:MAG: neutral zinc metallopeptidase [Candidatus Arsenophonus phytopathogenicus]
MHWKERRESEQVEDRRNTAEAQEEYTSLEEALKRRKKKAKKKKRKLKYKPLLAEGFVFSHWRGWAWLAVILVLLLGGYRWAFAASEQVSAPSSVNRFVDENEAAKFTSVILASTEDAWRKIFAEGGGHYRLPKLVIYRGETETGCGTGYTLIGPFYCPADRTIYIDLSFYDEMKNRLGADGKFAFGYVIAHEVGHHIQHLRDVLKKVDLAQANMSRKSANKLSVKLELQADCYAGVWGHFVQQAGWLEMGDLDDALNAAKAIGDDRLQREGHGRVVPETFTHGTSAQRHDWFKRGFDSGDPKQCNTFKEIR